MLRSFFLYAMLIITSSSCVKNEADVTTLDWFKPTPQTSFDWDLRDDIPSTQTYTATIIDIDAFDNTADFVANLQAQGKKVIAYVSVGSLEYWRADATSFPSEIIGNNYPGWDGERFLDIKNIEVLAPIMQARLDMIKEKGFDGVEPDNIDLNTWTTAQLGFEITDADVITYSKWLAKEAHQRGLSVGQKNTTDLADELVDVFDWILLEDIFFDNAEEEAKIYITRNKAVFATEYTDETNSFEFQNTVCPKAELLQYYTILKHRELDDYIETCN